MTKWPGLHIHKVDITYLAGLAIAGWTVWTHDYNPGAFVFAAACLGLPSLWRAANGHGPAPPDPDG